MRLCHLDRHPGFDRCISQQLIAVHKILIDPVIRKIYDRCGVRAVMRKYTTFFAICVTIAHFTDPSVTSGTDLQHENLSPNVTQ